MTNEDVIDLYNRVKMGTIAVVLAPNQIELVAAGSTMGLECSWRAPAHEETPAPLRPKRSLFPRLW